MTNAKNDKTPDVLYWVKVLIFMALTFGFGYLEPWGSLNSVGMKVLGIFLGMLFGWTFIGFIWPSILGLIALGFSGYATVPAVVSAGMGNFTVTVFCIFLFVMNGYIDQAGLTTWIANWFISRKIAINRPWILTSLIFLCVYFMAITVGIFAGILLLWNIFYRMCDTTGYKPYEPYTVFVLVGIVFAGTLGFAVVPFKAVQVVVLGALATASSGTVPVNLGSFTIVCVAMSMLCLLLYVLAGRYLFKVDVSKLMNRGDLFENLRGQKLNVEQKIAVAFLVYYFVALFIPSILPTTHGIGLFFNSLGQAGTLLVGLAVLGIIKLNGKHIFDFSSSAKYIQWDLVIMFMATMPLSSAMSAKDVGVIKFIVEIITPIFGGMSPVVFSVLFLVAMAILTQVAHNLVLAAMIPPIMYGFCVSLGMDANTIAMLTTLFSFAISIAIATPGGSTTSAMIFANTEWIDVKSAYKYTIIAAITGIISLLVIGFPVGLLVF